MRSSVNIIIIWIKCSYHWHIVFYVCHYAAVSVSLAKRVKILDCNLLYKLYYQQKIYITYIISCTKIPGALPITKQHLRHQLKEISDKGKDMTILRIEPKTSGQIFSALPTELNSLKNYKADYCRYHAKLIS